MGIEITPVRLFLGATAPVQFNHRINSLSFKGNIEKQDSFQKFSVDKFYDENFIKSMISQNEELKNILKKNNISVRLNMTELLDLRQNHCKTTQDVAGAIVKNLPPALKSQVDIKNLKDGAMLHDFGKVLIPSEILNKNGKLTEEEYRIMNLHSELGYQLLKNTGVNDEVLNLIRHHHENMENGKDFIPDVNLQILNLADKYSALTEKRVYKNPLSPWQALTILNGEVQKGEIHPILFHALVKSVNYTPQRTSAVKI